LEVHEGDHSKVFCTSMFYTATQSPRRNLLQASGNGGISSEILNSNGEKYLNITMYSPETNYNRYLEISCRASEAGTYMVRVDNVVALDY